MFGDFSTVSFTMTGLGGEPRTIKAGVVGGSFFEVMGLHPTLGRLLDARDDGPKAAGAAVLTHRFWNTTLNADPADVLSLANRGEVLMLLGHRGAAASNLQEALRLLDGNESDALAVRAKALLAQLLE